MTPARTEYELRLRIIGAGLAWVFCDLFGHRYAAMERRETCFYSRCHRCGHELTTPIFAVQL